VRNEACAPAHEGLDTTYDVVAAVVLLLLPSHVGQCKNNIACVLAHNWLMNSKWKLVRLRMMSMSNVTLKIDVMLRLGAIALLIIG
jgi:hypothetical protein